MWTDCLIWSGVNCSRVFRKLWTGWAVSSDWNGSRDFIWCERVSWCQLVWTASTGSHDVNWLNDFIWCGLNHLGVFIWNELSGHVYGMWIDWAVSSDMIWTAWVCSRHTKCLDFLIWYELLGCVPVMRKLRRFHLMRINWARLIWCDLIKWSYLMWTHRTMIGKDFSIQWHDKTVSASCLIVHIAEYNHSSHPPYTSSTGWVSPVSPEPWNDRTKTQLSRMRQWRDPTLAARSRSVLTWTLTRHRNPAQNVFAMSSLCERRTTVAVAGERLEGNSSDRRTAVVHGTEFIQEGEICS
jgi:hypothetical protein